VTTATIPIEHFTMWLAHGERGLSSEAIVAHLTGVPVGRQQGRYPDHPYDPDDFRRCELLLRSYPLARLTFPSMRSASPTWAALVDVWDELIALADEEAPGWIDGKGSAPKMYARMREIRDRAAVAS
jgi:hypothetical protein